MSKVVLTGSKKNKLEKPREEPIEEEEEDSSNLVETVTKRGVRRVYDKEKQMENLRKAQMASIVSRKKNAELHKRMKEEKLEKTLMESLMTKYGVKLEEVQDNFNKISLQGSDKPKVSGYAYNEEEEEEEAEVEIVRVPVAKPKPKPKPKKKKIVYEVEDTTELEETESERPSSPELIVRRQQQLPRRVKETPPPPQQPQIRRPNFVVY